MAIAKNAPAAPPQEQYVSMNPNSFSHGLIDDIDVTVTDALTCEWDYNGNAPVGPALAVEYTDPNDNSTVQYYSAGKLEDWKPSSDGHGFVVVSGKTGVNDGTNVGKFIASLVKAGFPAAAFDAGDLKVIIGTKCHVKQEAQERKGLVRTGKNADRPMTTLLVTTIYSYPPAIAKAHNLPATPTAAPAASASAAKPAAAAKTKAAAGGKPNGEAAAQPAAQAAAQPAAPSAAAQATVADGNLDIDQIIADALVAKLSMTGEAIPKKGIAQIVFETFDQSDDLKKVRNRAIARSGQAEFLKSLSEQGISFDGTQVALAG